MRFDFQVTGMTCAACSARVEKVTGQVPGVIKVEVNLLAGTMSVEAEDQTVVTSVLQAVEKAGYNARIAGEKTKPEGIDVGLGKMKRRLIWSLAFLVVLMYFTMGHMVGLPVPNWYHGRENAVVAALLQFMLTLPPVVLNRVYYTKGVKALWHRAPNMDSLIAVGSGAALIYGVIALFRMAYAMGHGDWQTVDLYSENLYFESAAMIVTLITLGKFLETRAKGKTGDAVRQLMDLRPVSAVVKTQDGEKRVPVEDVKLGDIVIVRSGESIPVDGVVVSGRASVDQSALTGESVPVEIEEGMRVAAAAINTEGYLEIHTDKIGEDTTLAQVIRLVEQAGGSKAPIARLADKISGVFVPVVMGIALITFLSWMFVGKGFEFALSAGISVLVISCPCALGLATPVAIMVGTGVGARMGVLYKNAQVLENVQKVDTVVLDKTGTLTQGKPAVTDILPGALAENVLLQIAASLEEKSEHPFGRAIVKKGEDLERLPVDEFETLPGRGVCGVINGVRIYGGNERLMQEQGIAVPSYPELSQEGKTPLYFARQDGTFLGAIAAADVLKPDAEKAVQQLRKQGLNVVMLTGDNEQTAKSIAAKAGISQVIADVLPADKASAVSQLQAGGHKVLMVGDGINDAPALVTADIGMAIGAGTDIAIEAADIVLMKNSLLCVADAICLSKAAKRNIKQNLFWAFFYNMLGIPIAAGVLYPAFGILLNPMIGAAFMSVSSVFVVTNALRLRFFKPLSGQSNEEKTEVKGMEMIIKVNGMMCPHCQARVESVCKAIPGVTNAVVDLQLKQVTVSGNGDLNAVKKAITDAGYEVVEN